MSTQKITSIPWLSAFRGSLFCFVLVSSLAATDAACAQSDCLSGESNICDPNEENIGDNMDIKTVELAQDLENLYITFEFYGDQLLFDTPLYIYHSKDSNVADSVIKAYKDNYEVFWPSSPSSGMYDVSKYQGKPVINSNRYTVSVPFVKLMEGAYSVFYHWTYSMDTKERVPDTGRFEYRYKAVNECRNTDAGINYYIYGALYLNGQVAPAASDSCNGKKLLEVECSNTEEYRTIEYECPYGCEDGVCVRENTAASIDQAEEIIINKGIGLTPGYLQWTSVAAGDKVNKSIRFFRKDRNMNATIEMIFDKRGPLSWLTYSGEKAFDFESGDESVFKQFYLQVPAQASPGDYEEKIVIKSNYAESGNNFESYFVLPLKVTVTDEQAVKQEMTEAARKPVAMSDSALKTRVKGKIILKIEDSGKAYYVHPLKDEMHYLGLPDDAFRVMRGQGAGIRNSDLYKIPVGSAGGEVDSDKDGIGDNLEMALGLDGNNADTDGDGFSDGAELANGFSPWGAGKQALDKAFANRQKGRIFLQVEKKGEAWYVNPTDGKRYYLGRPADAFRIMRKLGLGISDKDYASLCAPAGESGQLADEDRAGSAGVAAEPGPASSEAEEPGLVLSLAADSANNAVYQAGDKGKYLGGLDFYADTPEDIRIGLIPVAVTNVIPTYLLNSDIMNESVENVSLVDGSNGSVIGQAVKDSGVKGMFLAKGLDLMVRKGEKKRIKIYGDIKMDIEKSGKIKVGLVNVTDMEPTGAETGKKFAVIKKDTVYNYIELNK